MKIGDIVHTIKGAKFWGRIIALDNDKASPGCTVLAIDPGFAGTKHVYPLKQLAIRPATPSADVHECPICAKPINEGDECSIDIEMGTCHAECLEGSPTVNLETGDPVDGPIPHFRYEAGSYTVTGCEAKTAAPSPSGKESE